MDKLFFIETGDERMYYCRKYLYLNRFPITDNILDADYIIMSLKSEYKNIYKNKDYVFCYSKDIAKAEKNVVSYCTKQFINENSRLTAQGTISIILNNIIVDFSKLNILVLGYGNCGKAVCDMFIPLCENITCYARNELLKEEITTKNINYINRLYDISMYDVIVNTIPFNILNNNLLNKLNENNIYIEIASSPYGFDVSTKDKYKFKYIQGSGLPGKYTPKSAGENIAKSVISILKEDGYE